RVSLGNIFYKINEMGKVDLKARVDVRSQSIGAEERIRALQPPPSVESAHEDYLAAVIAQIKDALTPGATAVWDEVPDNVLMGVAQARPVHLLWRQLLGDTSAMT